MGKNGKTPEQKQKEVAEKMLQLLDSFIQKPSELDAKEEDTEFAKKIKQLMGDKTLDAQQMIELIKNELDQTSQMQLEEMLRCGCSLDEVIQHFMNRERNKKGQKRNEFGRKI